MRGRRGTNPRRPRVSVQRLPPLAPPPPFDPWLDPWLDPDFVPPLLGRDVPRLDQYAWLLELSWFEWLFAFALVLSVMAFTFSRRAGIELGPYRRAWPTPALGGRRR